jgi:tRNA threonylcarbamoyladenosine biosynthesis protein TsaB
VRILALDTSTAITSCALVDLRAPDLSGDGEAVVWEKELVEKAGDALPLALGDLDGVQAVAVGLGPGSFTGLRVGLAAAKALSYARKLPVAGASSLHALAVGQAGLVCAAIDARRGELFTQLFRDGAAEGEVRIVLAADLRLDGARLVRGTPSAAAVAHLCRERLMQPYDEASCFALAPDYRQGFANLT